MTAVSALNTFHPLVARWFETTYGSPTDIQRKAWPAIAAGDHVLITAPTGTGKTLTAFLWALNQLLSGVWEGGTVRALYVSPLKALNTDIRENLLTPLDGIRDVFANEGLVCPPIAVLTRSGDTTQRDRQRMLRTPPEILITTPESLNLILSSPRARTMLSGVRTVILDEIHALASDKRGSYLITAVERLALLAGEFQRIGVSATVKPLATVAEFVGGHTLEMVADEPVYRRRSVTVVRSESVKELAVAVRHPTAGPPALAPDEHGSQWMALAEQLRELIGRNRSTLLFVNSRRQAEKVARLINEAAGASLAYAHHGSLSKELRTVVEQRLRAGELAAIVATSSLEMGIDIGKLDEVVLIQCPFSVAGATQRIGRAGHSVDAVSRGVIYPMHGRDFVDCAVMARQILDRNIEEVAPVLCPLDILAQIIVSMTGIEPWNLDRLYHFLRTSYPFHELPRRQFDLVVQMLGGRYEETRIRELRPRVSVDTVSGTISAKQGMLRLVYSSGGTIPDRGYYGLRVAGSLARIGELDEEFVWERRVGDTFTLGTQHWRIAKIGHRDVEVIPWHGPVGMSPFWRAESINRAFHFAEQVGVFLEEWGDRCSSGAFHRELTGHRCMDIESADGLVRFLELQKQHTGAPLPHRHHVLIEHLSGSGTAGAERRTLMHTLWGNRVNFPVALALEAAWDRKHGSAPEIVSNNDCIFLACPMGIEELLELVAPEALEQLVRARLESSGFFGARFRENAGRALLLPRSGMSRRTPLWLTRRRARELLARVSRYEDFPILTETWRTCLRDEIDLRTARALLEELRTGETRVTTIATAAPSPFAASTVWQTTSSYMYEGDTPGAGRSNLSAEVLRDLVFTAELRPAVDPDAVDELLARLHRTAPGYAPRKGRELVDWLKERVLVPHEEWQELLAAVARDHGIGRDDIVEAVANRACTVRLPGAGTACTAAVETVPRLLRALGLAITAVDIHPLGKAVKALDTAIEKLTSKSASKAGHDPGAPLESMVGEWLAQYGPMKPEAIRRVFGIGQDRLDEVMSGLAEEKRIATDVIIGGSTTPHLCDAENLERLLRIGRRRARPSFEARPIEQLGVFLATWQGVRGTPGGGDTDIRRPMERLFGYPARASLWETAILPTRVVSYTPHMLDTVIQESDLTWFGCGRQTLAFCFEQDTELFTAGSTTKREQSATADHRQLFPDGPGVYHFSEMVKHSGIDSSTLTLELWKAVWAGRVTCDTFQAVRWGIKHNFKCYESTLFGVDEARRMARRALRASRWNAPMPLPGHWHARTTPARETDLLDEEELRRDRVRQLLERYGILFRELLQNELPLLRWGNLFRTLRIMELGGEIVSGRFFEDIPGPQFMSPAAFRLLEQGPAEDVVYWLNATDPASLCGVDIPGLKQRLPHRLPTTHVVYHGARPVLVSRKQGREIEIMVTPDDPNMSSYCASFASVVSNPPQPFMPTRIATINRRNALESPYRDSFLDAGFLWDHKALVFQPRHWTADGPGYIR